jgi:hypothetical protein
MRSLKTLALCTLLAAAASSFLGPVHAQSDSPADIKSVADAVQTLADQQKTIADNQSKIDEKLADIAQNIHDARLYSSRAR